MPTQPVPPPLDFPTRIDFSGIAPGAFASAGGGGLPHAAANVSMRIDGDSNGVFSLVSLETQALVRQHDPELPPTDFTFEWITAQVVEGAGPISINSKEALLATVGFTCPADPQQEVFTAMATLTAPDAVPPVSFTVPLEATVVGQSLSIFLFTAPPQFFAGTTQNFTIRLTSTFRTTVVGRLTCDSNPPTAFSSDVTLQGLPAPAVPIVLEPQTSVDVILPVSCAAGTVAGDHPVTFAFVDVQTGTNLASIVATVKTLGTRTVTIKTNQPTELTIPLGTSVALEIEALVSDGGGSQFRIGTVSAPPAIFGPGTVIKDLPLGSVVIDATIACVAQPHMSTGKQSLPLILGWTVPADTLHPADVSGQITFNITIPAVSQTFDVPAISAGKVTASNITASFASNGGWTFSGSLHDFSTVFGDNFALGFAFNFTDDAVHGPSVSGELGSSLTSNPEDFRFGINNNDPWLVDNWQAAFAGGGIFRLHVSDDPGQVFSDLGDDFKTFFGKTIWKPFAGKPCPIDAETGEPDCPESNTIDPGNDGGGGDGA